jgi:hypothetical protein
MFDSGWEEGWCCWWKGQGLVFRVMLNRRLVSVGDSGEGRVNYFLFVFWCFKKKQYQHRLKKHVNN